MKKTITAALLYSATALMFIGTASAITAQPAIAQTFTYGGTPYTITFPWNTSPTPTPTPTPSCQGWSQELSLQITPPDPEPGVDITNIYDSACLAGVENAFSGVFQKCSAQGGGWTVGNVQTTVGSKVGNTTLTCREDFQCICPESMQVPSE